jgi:hypothetical protein
MATIMLKAVNLNSELTLENNPRRGKVWHRTIFDWIWLCDNIKEGILILFKPNRKTQSLKSSVVILYIR